MKVISKKLLDYLEPLVEWKILSLDNLIKENNYKVKKKWLSKVVLQTQRLGITESYYHPFSSKKYVYLTEVGRKILATGNRSFAPDEDLFKGAIVSEIIYKINCLISLKDIKFKDFKDNFEADLYNADVHFSHEEKKYSLSFIYHPIKSSRISKIVKHQFKPNLDDDLIFVFARDNHQETFEKHFQVEKNLQKRVNFFYLPSILSSDIDLYESLNFLKLFNIKKANPKRQPSDTVLTQCFDTS